MRTQNDSLVERQISERELSREENQIGEPRGRMRRWGRLEVGWPVSWCGSSNYGMCVPSMGSTQIQDIAEGQGVRRQKGEPKREPGRRAKKRNRQRGTRQEEPKRNHLLVSRERGEWRGERFFAYAQNDSLVGR